MQLFMIRDFDLEFSIFLTLVTFELARSFPLKRLLILHFYDILT